MKQKKLIKKLLKTWKPKKKTMSFKSVQGSTKDEILESTMYYCDLTHKYTTHNRAFAGYIINILNKVNDEV